jgi:hypothetical protein
MQEIPRDWEPALGTGDKDQILEQKILLVPLLLRKLEGF